MLLVVGTPKSNDSELSTLLPFIVLTVCRVINPSELIVKATQGERNINITQHEQEINTGVIFTMRPGKRKEEEQEINENERKEHPCGTSLRK